MNITIVGAGNIGTQFAVHCASKGHLVTMYTSKPDLIRKQLFIVDSKGSILRAGKIKGATSDEKEAFENAELVFVTVPAFAMQTIAEKMFPYIKQGIKVGLIPGTGGGECAFRSILEKGGIIFGLQRVPSVARLVEYGQVVCATGYRDILHVAALPKCYSLECGKLMEEIFDMTCEVLPCYLNLTLTPSNPILHTTRLRVIFKDYQIGNVYDEVPLFYEHWNDESSGLLVACDAEVQMICKSLKQFDLSSVKSLLVHYESENAEQLTRKIRSIQGFKGLTTPHVKLGNRYLPDLHSRYFTADFSYGLTILKQIADLVEISVPNIQETLEWYQKISLEKKEFCYANYGICDIKTFTAFYNR